MNDCKLMLSSSKNCILFLKPTPFLMIKPILYNYYIYKSCLSSLRTKSTSKSCGRTHHPSHFPATLLTFQPPCSLSRHSSTSLAPQLGEIGSKSSITVECRKEFLSVVLFELLLGICSLNHLEVYLESLFFC